MKFAFLTTLLCLCFAGNSTNYYFSSSIGDDSRTALQAQNPATPWKTIQKLNAFFPSLQPGDSLLFRRNDVFEGRLNLSRSGTPLKNIVLAAYGAGAKPVFSGLSKLKSFSLYSGKIWQHTVSGSRPNVLLVNGLAQALGRYPNHTATGGGYLHYESHVGTSVITDNELTSAINWTGGEIVIRKNRWILERSPITAHSGGTLTFSPTTTYEGPNNFGYFIQNHLKALDKDGEWYFDAGQKKIYLYKEAYAAATTDVKASVVDTLFSINHQSNLTLKGLHFVGANETGLSIANSRYITVTDCEFTHSGLNAVLLNASSFITVENSQFRHSLNNAINTLWNCRNLQFRYNHISNTGMVPGMGKTGNLSYQALTVKGKNILVEYNRIDSTGYVPIRFEGDSVVIQNNVINHFLTVKDDGGAIYTWNADYSAPENVYRVVRNNLVLNGIGAGAGTSKPNHPHAQGIYLDDNSANVEISGNTVAGCSESGLYIHNSRKTVVRDNTFYNNARQVFLQHDNISPQWPVRNVELKENILYAKTAAQQLMHLRSIKDDIGLIGASYSNYFSRPIDSTPSLYTAYTRNNTEFVQNYDLQTWAGDLGYDRSSKTSPVQTPLYQPKGFTGSNKVINSTFNANVQKLYGYFYSGSFRTEWNSGGKLDGGCLQLTLDTVTNNRGFIIMDIGSVTAGKTYLLRFSLLGKSNNKSIGFFLRKTGAPYTRISDVGYTKVLNTRTENEFLITPTATESAASLLFDFSDQNTLWMDNIQLTEAAVDLADPDDYVRFEYNDSNSPKTVTLDTTYVDAKNNQYAGTTTLAPYTSLVLWKTQATKAAQNISFAAPATKTFGDAPFALSGTATSGLPVTYKIVSGPATISGNTVTLTGTGIVIIEALQAGNASFFPADPVVQTFPVNPATEAKISQRIAFASLSWKTFGCLPFSMSATASSGLPVNYRVVSGPAIVTGNTVTVTGAGTVTIEAFQTGNEIYLDATPVRRSFTVVKAPQTISFSTISNKIFGDATFSLNATATSDLPVVYRVVSGPAIIDANQVVLTGSGTVTIAAAQPGDANYNAAVSVSRTFAVAAGTVAVKQAQVIRFDSLPDLTYGDENFVLNAMSSSGLYVNYRVVSGPATITDTLVSITGVGAVVIEASQPGDSTYLAAIPVLQRFVVAKANQWISFDPVDDKTAADAPFELSATASSGLLVAYRIVSGPAVVSNSVVTLTGAGTVVVEAYQSGDSLYNEATAETQSFVVENRTKQNQTISFGTLGYKTYSSPSFALNAAASSDLPVSFRVVSGPVSISGNIVTITGVGSATIEASQSGDATFKAAKPVVRSFTVGKASQFISFGTPGSKNMGDLPFALNATSTSGLTVTYRVLSGPAKISGTVVTVTGAGNVSIEATQPGNSLYQPAVAIIRTFVVTADASAASTNSVASASGFNVAPVKPETTLLVYPNPVQGNGTIRITAGESTESTLSVFDAGGRLVWQKANIRLQESQTVLVKLEVGEWRSGVYVVRLMTRGKAPAVQTFLVTK